MPGTLLQIIPRTEFSYGTSLGQAISPGPVILAKNVDISQWREQTLLVRLHTATWSSGASITVIAYATDPAHDDPALDFNTNSAVATVTFTQGASGESAPKLKTGAVTTGGAFLTIVAGVTQGSSGSASLSATISIDLSLKS